MTEFNKFADSDAEFHNFVASEEELEKNLINYLNEDEKAKEVYLNVKVVAVSNVLGVMLGRLFYETDISPEEYFKHVNDNVMATAMEKLESLQYDY